MKLVYFVLVQILLIDICNAQDLPFDSLIKRGKAQFDKKIDSPNYDLAIKNLKAATTLNPGNAEAHYFLGYAYSRFNSRDGETIPQMKMPLVLLASKELEKVNVLTPFYNGEYVVLDPYSKITSEWGALALSYMANHKPDSAAWALAEGKKRGGFDEFILSFSRAALNNCSKNSILISCGDNYTFPLFYLKVVEKLRTDVSLIDIDMLNTHWYAKFLEQTTRLKFGFKEPALDTLDYKQWTDSLITIPIYNTNSTFKWTLKPTNQDYYILRGDRLMLGLLIKNGFKNEIYFTKNFASEQQLGLTEYLLNYPSVDKLNVMHEQPEPIDQYVKDTQVFISSIRFVNPYSIGEVVPIDGLRYEIINKTEKDDKLGFNKSGAGLAILLKNDKLNGLLKNYLSLSKFPCYDNDVKDYLTSKGFN